MAKAQFIVTSNCRIDGKHIAKGTVLTFDLPSGARDLGTASDIERHHLLRRAERLEEFSEKRLKEIKAEADREEQDAKDLREEEKALRIYQRKQRLEALKVAA